jgi:penicillin-binding protein 2
LSTDKLRKIFTDPGHPLFDRVIQGQYAPGSLFKLVTAMAALESKEFDINKEYTCNGYITIGYDRRIYRCWKDKKHGKLNMLDAIAHSCNVYFYQLGMDLGYAPIRNAGRSMGIGAVSQDIFEGEKSGLLPDEQWKKKRFGIGWYPGDSANMSVGQGYVLVNPFQVLRVISAIAAEGRVYTPHLLKMVISPDGKVVTKNTPHLERELIVSNSTLKTLKDAMTKVTEYGTAQYLNVPFEAAAKTGTAENPHGDDHAWFACFAPVDSPQIAVVVLVENGGYGSTAAMPVAREILKEFFKGLTYAKAD